MNNFKKKLDLIPKVKVPKNTKFKSFNNIVENISLINLTNSQLRLLILKVAIELNKRGKTMTINIPSEKIKLQEVKK